MAKNKSDKEKESLLNRAIYKIFGAIDKAASSALDKNPKVTRMNGEYERLRKYVQQHADEMRKKYPDDFARADKQLRRLTGER